MRAIDPDSGAAGRFACRSFKLPGGVKLMLWLSWLR